MKQFSIFHPLWMAFYAKSIYRDVAKNWTGIAALYLLLLLALCSIPTAYRFNQMLHVLSDRDILPIVNQIPTLVFQGGALHTEKNQPYFIKGPDQQVMAIIDTSGTYDSLDDVQSVNWLLTGSTLFHRVDETRIHAYAIRNLTQKSTFFKAAFSEDAFKNQSPSINVAKTHPPKEMIVTAPLLENQILKMQRMFETYNYFMILAVYFVYRLIQIFIYALIGLLFALLFHAQLSYGAMVRLTTIAMTPVIFIDTVTRYMSFTHPHKELLFFLLAMVYLLFGVYANSQRSYAK